MELLLRGMLFARFVTTAVKDRKVEWVSFGNNHMVAVVSDPSTALPWGSFDSVTFYASGEHAEPTATAQSFAALVPGNSSLKSATGVSTRLLCS